MRLVIKYSVGDGYTWHADEVVPVVYESAEAFLVDFEAIVMDHKAKNSWRSPSFDLAGQSFNYTDFFQEGVYHAPEIMTIDEWFQSEGIES
jgi:hypothetical protein